MVKNEKADTVKDMERGKDILLLCDRKSLPGEMLGELPDVIWRQGATWPRLVLVDCAREGTLEAAEEMLRHRVPVVFWNVQDSQCSELRFLGRTARRNKVAAALLGSYRWLPAVATVKEIASGGCLGADLQLKAIFGGLGELERLRAQDCAEWILGGGKAIVTDEEDEMHLYLFGSAGRVVMEATLDGKQASCAVNICGKSRSREIPIADPARVELGVLRVSLPPEGKISALSLLMPLP